MTTVHHDFRFRLRPRNGCSGCGEDFTSVKAFDKHRVGSFKRVWPHHSDGRRCISDSEMVAAGLEQDGNGRWGVAESVPGVSRAAA